MSNERSKRKVVVGVVTSDSMDKTITVKSERITMHPQFKKYIKRHSSLHAHDEESVARQGDVVEVVECRPLSKTKSFRLLRIVRRGRGNAGEGEAS